MDILSVVCVVTVNRSSQTSVNSAIVKSVILNVSSKCFQALLRLGEQLVDLKNLYLLYSQFKPRRNSCTTNTLVYLRTVTSSNFPSIGYIRSDSI